MFVELSVSSEYNIKFIRASVDNSDLAPIFGTSFFYPEDKNAQLAFSLDMDAFPTTSSAPYYLHIAVDDGIKLSHKYLEVILVNAPLKYQGFNLVTCTNKTHISWYNSNNVEQKTYTLNGNVGDAASSIASQLFYITTTIPDRLYAFKQDNLEIKWEKEPEMPFPYYTDLKVDQNFLFVGYGNERIDAFDGQSGFLQIGTPILVDSVPKKIGVADSFFIGYFEKRTGVVKTLVSFYLATGATYNKLETDIEVLEFYPTGQTNILDIIGNKNDKGYVATYYFDDNKLKDLMVFEEGPFSHSSRLSEGVYMLSIENRIYKLDKNTNTFNLVLTLISDVVDIQFDHINQRVFVAQMDGIEIYSYPGLQQLGSILSDKSVKAIRLSFGY